VLFAFGALTYAAHPEGILEYQKRRWTLRFERMIFHTDPLAPGSGPMVPGGGGGVVTSNGAPVTASPEPMATSPEPMATDHG